MSLIHDALKSMDAAPAVARSAHVHHRPVWPWATLAGAVLTLGAALLWWQMQPAAQAPLRAQAPAPQPPAPLAPQPDAAEPTPALLPAQALPATSVAVAAPARPRPAQPPRRSATTPKPAPVPAPAQAAADDTPIEARFAHFSAAMKDGRQADAQKELAALRARLPEGTLSLMRAQAWHDLSEGRAQAAAAQYRRLLQRLPGDEGAAINLAALLLREGQTEQARATLDAAARLSPQSAALQAALAQFTPGARP